MGERDYRTVLRDMRMANGTLMPIPITLPLDSVDGLEIGTEVVLRSPTNDMLAVMLLEEIFPWDLEQRVQGCAQHHRFAPSARIGDAYLGPVSAVRTAHGC